MRLLFKYTYLKSIPVKLAIGYSACKIFFYLLIQRGTPELVEGSISKQKDAKTSSV